MSKSVDIEFKNILRTEWSYKFEDLMKSKVEAYRGISEEVPEFNNHFCDLQKKAMIMSYYKYGKLRRNHGEENLMDAIANLKKRLEKYEETGNTEFLVDVANFAMIEFTCPQHENAHFEGTDGEDVVELIGFGINQLKDI